MGSKAIHQLPFTDHIEAGDLGYLARPYGLNSYLDRSFDLSTVFPQITPVSAFIPSATVLTLSTAVQIVPAPASDKTIVPLYWIYDITGTTTPYATNTTMSFGLQAMTTGNDLSQVLINQSVATRIIVYPNTNSGYMTPGAPMYARVIAGNPTAGTGDISITTYYYLV